DRISVTRLATALGFLAALAAGPLQAQTPPLRGPSSARPAAPATAAPAPAAPAPVPKPAAAAPAPAPAPASAPSGPGSREPDLAYGAYQRGYFLTAFLEATKRVEQKNDVRAMTLLGELYSCQYCGVPVDEVKATKWYRLAADRGDRDAMFALGIFH